MEPPIPLLHPRPLPPTIGHPMPGIGFPDTDDETSRRSPSSPRKDLIFKFWPKIQNASSKIQIFAVHSKFFSKIEMSASRVQ